MNPDIPIHHNFDPKRMAEEVIAADVRAQSWAAHPEGREVLLARALLNAYKRIEELERTQ